MLPYYLRTLLVAALLSLYILFYLRHHHYYYCYWKRRKIYVRRVRCYSYHHCLYYLWENQCIIKSRQRLGGLGCDNKIVGMPRMRVMVAQGWWHFDLVSFLFFARWLGIMLTVTLICWVIYAAAGSAQWPIYHQRYYWWWWAITHFFSCGAASVRHW